MEIESLYKTALGMCQMMLRERLSESSGNLTLDTIKQAVDEIAALPMFSCLDRPRLIAELEERFTVYAPVHHTLGEDDNHIPWLHSKIGSVPWRYWDRYKLYLQDRIPSASLESLERVVDDVLSRLENPDREGAWDRRGLVMGHVQSGKTANYCGLICKAADAGYKVIIILSGIHNSLRSQTQIRLDEGFLGFMSEPRTGGNTQTFRKVGVGLIDGSIHANTGTNRTETGDFSTAVANQFGIHPGGLPLSFVIKKNAGVLKNILGWIRSHADAPEPVTNRRFVRNVPVLVIDDEADLASIDTGQQNFDELGKPDPDHNPTSINKLIRNVLRSFEKVAYVGYTATPFANIFIHDRGYTPELGDDLFPKNFIVNSEAPSNYLGPARTFGITGEEDAGLEKVEPLPVLRIVSDHAVSEALDEENGWMPPRLVKRTDHRPLYKNLNCVPPSLRTAMMSFILAVTARKLREAGPHHNSMLVHVVRFTKVQHLIADQVEIARREILQRLQNGDGDRTPTIESEFSQLWDNDFVPTNRECQRLVGERAAPSLPPQWTRVAALLPEVTASIRVKEINGSARDVLDYEEHRASGMNIIAIGGDKLSRGLTLEGLSVSYFLRASRMYDTLMQMGRWFGYRDGYIDVCRLYTTSELREWFAHIAVASEELQHEFRHMWGIGGTPREYGLKVRSHPVMLVTSMVKMRNGTEMPLSFSGNISETIFFQNNPGWINRNFITTENWLTSLGRPAAGHKSGGYKWEEVPAQSVLEFLRSYATYPPEDRKSELWVNYIATQLSHNELTRWTVVLNSSGSGAEESITNLDIGLVKRDQDPSAKIGNRYTARQIVDPGDEIGALTKEQWETALALTIKNWKELGERKLGDKPPTRPGRKESRDESVRSKTHGLLLIYPLDPTYPTVKEGGVERRVLGDSVKPVIGIAVSFPESKTALPISYVVNNVFTQRGGDDDSF